eukprot:Awhi_evm3s2575
MKLLGIINPHAPAPIIQIIADQGKEYFNESLRSRLAEIGVTLTTVPKITPQMMLCERGNQTLNDMTRCILNQSGLPESWWT